MVRASFYKTNKFKASSVNFLQNSLDHNTVQSNS